VLVLVGISIASLAMAYYGSSTRPLANCSMDDTVRYFEPMSTYEREVLAEGRLPLWNPYQACGTPLLAMMQTSPFYPGNWPAMLWSVTGFKIATGLHIALAFAGTLLWLTSLGIALPGALTGAIVYATNGAMLHAVCTQSFHYAVSWWPWLFWAVNRLVANPRPRAAGVLALVVGATILTGGIQYVVYGGYALGAYVAMRLGTLLVQQPGKLPRVLAYLAVGGICGVALSLVQLLPSMEASGLSQRSSQGLTPLQITVFGSLGAVRAAQELVTYQSGGYLGTALLLLGVACLNTRELSIRLTFGLMAVVSWLLTTGSGPVFDIFTKLPTGNWFRGPTRLFSISVFATATLSALAVQDLLSEDKRRPRLLAFAVIATLICYLLDPPQRWYAVAIAVLLVAAHLASSLPPTQRRVIALGIPLILLVEALVTAVNPLAQFDSITKYSGRNAKLVGFLKTPVRMSRVHFRHGFDFGLPVKSGMRHHLYADLDFDAFISQRMTEYWEYLSLGVTSGKNFENGDIHLTSNAPNLHLLDYLSTRYIIESPWEPFLIPGNPLISTGFRHVFRAQGYSIVENLRSHPRLTVVARAELSEPGEPLLRRLADREFPAGGTVLVEDPQDVIDAPSGAAGTAVFVYYRAESVEVAVAATTPGMLLLNDQLYPGWRATVDGVPARIAMANYLFRGVKVPQGQHRVRFEYRPFSLYFGGVLSTLGVIGVALLFVAGRRRA
jgi:hypothetical protein